MMILVFWMISYTLPYDSPVTDRIEYLHTRGLIEVPMSRPYFLHWLVPQIDSIILYERVLTAADRRALELLTPFFTKSETFSATFHLSGLYEKEPLYYHGMLDYRAGGRLFNNLYFSHGMRFQRASEIDSFGPKPWRDLQVYMTEGLIQYYIGSAYVQAGRTNYLHGYGDGSSLLLSLDRQGYDGCALFIPARFLEFYTIFAVIDAPRERYLTIHRLGLRLGTFLSLGFSEALLFCRPFEPLYVNFLLPYYLTQWGTFRNDNIQWCFDARVRILGTTVFGELLIDDYMFEDDPYPDKLGWKTGFRSCFFDRFMTKFSYTFVDKWVYTHRYTQNIYEKDGLPIGYPLGNDVDRVIFSTSFVNRLHCHPRVYLEYTRKGEGSIFRPYEEEGGTWTPPFPSGVVEKKLDLRFGIEYAFKNNIYIQADIGKVWWENYGHEAGNDVDDTVLTAALWIVY
ncbi:hypothetical protein JXB22_09610 [candidate division WOR-3 bacterium]|nr:hypothetical protein [candidate division WOR-3 bacterium]